MAKTVKVSAFGAATFYTLPGNTADFMADVDVLDDTVFGVDYKSEQADIGSWQVNANAIYKGYSGYQSVIKKTGSPTTMTDEPMSLVSTRVYRITDATKRLIHIGTEVVVKDGSTDHTSDVETIDFLAGVVTFKSSYTVTGSVSITGSYLPASQICAMNKYTLTQQMEAIEETDLCVAQSNSGFRQYTCGLKTVSLELSGFYRSSSAFLTTLKNRDTVMIELNPDGVGNSVARGFFIAKSDKQSGKVGALEEENVSFALHVPDNSSMKYPFSWYHASGSTLNAGIRALLDAWQTMALVDVRYLEDGVAGKQGSAVPINMSMSGGLGALNEFSVGLKGSGGITSV